MLVSAGDRAPFAGVLLTPDALSALLLEVDRAREEGRIEADVARAEGEAKLAAARKAAAVELSTEREKRAALERDLDRRRVEYERAIAAAAKTPWYRSPYLSLLLGAVVGGGLATGVCYGATR